MWDSQAVLIRALLDPLRYDHPVDAVRLVETHISYVLLTGSYAYKIKKAVNLGFLDFSTLEKRQFNCQEELRLNRRFAPQLYLDLVAIGGSPEKPELNASGTTIEYAVRMVEFPQEALLDHMLEAGVLTPAHIDHVAIEVARFHSSMSSIPVPVGFGTPEAVHQPVRENFVQVSEFTAKQSEAELLGTLQAWSEAEFTRRQQDFSARLQNGFVRECHGDLHMGNMALIDGNITLFDCIEFSPNLRWIDVMSDVAFVVMDLEDRARPDLAHRFFNVYLERSGDFGGLRVLAYYLTYRAMVRAKVTSIRSRQPDLKPQGVQLAWRQAAAYMAIAARFTRPIHTWLLITHGYSGSGKTTATQLLLEQTGAIRLRSDVERKRLFGLAPRTRSLSGLNQGLYAPDAHIKTYQRLAELAREVLQAGFPVIVDATFLKKTERNTFKMLAEVFAIPFIILELQVGEAVLRQRITQRELQGCDASEATLHVLDVQLQGSDALTQEERMRTLTLVSGNAMENSLQTLARGLLDNPDKICQDYKF